MTGSRSVSNETAGEPPAASRARVLLVELDYEIRGLMGRFLAMQGFECRGAADLEGALRLCAVAGPFDLVIASAAPPEASGYELLARLRASSPGLPLLLLRGFPRVDSHQNRAAAARLGAHFLAKPIRLSTLLEAVVAALAEARDRATPAGATSLVRPATAADVMHVT